MSTEDERPDVKAVMAGLKDFQVATVDHVMRRLWDEDDPVRRFLVADEVGLGKTMVAKGVIAQTIDLLWDTVDRIDIVYICSNQQIARQNLARLEQVTGKRLEHADRLTMLPLVTRELEAHRVNAVSFTPATSFQLGGGGGRAGERVLLYWLLAAVKGTAHVGKRRWKRFFQGTVREESRFSTKLKEFDRSRLDANFAVAFGIELKGAPGPSGGLLEEELEACVDEFNYLRGNPSPALSRRRNRLIGALRGLVARAAVDRLQPDLVILDEFQRFTELLDGDDDASLLAKALFDYGNSKVLLLSATPYKMYTLPDEPDGEDHYRDFLRTVRFLAGEDHTSTVDDALERVRGGVFDPGRIEDARLAKDIAQNELRRVMCRTERLATSTDRHGMIGERDLPGLKLTADDVRAYRTLDGIANAITRQDMFEFWRSAPFALNMMDKGTYVVKQRLDRAIEEQDVDLRDAIGSAQGLLNTADIAAYRALDPANAKYRALQRDVLDRGAWRLAWLPPALPYYDLAGAYAEPELRSFTKRLIFSAWTVVPKAIAVLMSYEAERRAVDTGGTTRQSYFDRAPTPPLQYRMDGDRVAGMPVFALAYPSVTLARLGDPLEIARSIGTLPAPRDAVLAEIRRRIEGALESLPSGDAETGGAADQRWYWAAPILLDRLHEAERQQEYEDLYQVWVEWDVVDGGSGLRRHLDAAEDISVEDLGPRPGDLVNVLVQLALGGPGVCALRALSRVAGGAPALVDPTIRMETIGVTTGLRSLFNRPEIASIVRAEEGEGGVAWRRVLDQCVDGGLQAVLDEYAHVLLESEGLQHHDGETRARGVSEAMGDALEVRTASNVVNHFSVVGNEIESSAHRVRTHFAARFGHAKSDDAEAREQHLRAAFNSPFWPFVLASTSVGQEGLDFHTYSHAIVHWNLPGNPVDLEQREGRVHRYKGHAVRKNVAARHADAALHATVDDPWSAMFLAATECRAPGQSDIVPSWVYPGEALIERYVPALPLSSETKRYGRLLRTVGAYRLVIGQPRQEDLLRYVGDSDADWGWMRMDLAPTEPTT